MLTPQYKTLVWLVNQTWNQENLMRLNDSDIRTKQSQIDQVTADNQRLYETAIRQQNERRATFRADHPRKDYPPDLAKRPPKPPDVAGQWNFLLKKRRNAFNKVARDDKRAGFVNRMTKGRIRAMRHREAVILKLINNCAAQHSIALTERSIDKRLEELLLGVGVFDRDSLPDNVYAIRHCVSCHRPYIKDTGEFSVFGSWFCNDCLD